MMRSGVKEYTDAMESRYLGAGRTHVNYFQPAMKPVARIGVARSVCELDSFYRRTRVTTFRTPSTSASTSASVVSTFRAPAPPV